MDHITLLVKDGKGKTSIVKISHSSSITALFTEISHRTGISINYQDLIFSGRLLQKLKNGRRQNLSDYSIHNKSILSVVVSFMSCGSKEYEKFQNGVEFTEEQDMLNWCDDPDNPRAKMPCGHPICADTLIDYCQSLLNEGKYEFQCPFIDNKTMQRCGMIWDYDVIRQILILTEEEKKIFETKLSDNLLKSSREMRTCPNCRVSCTRQNITDKRIQCLMCEKNGKRYEFCWQCLGEWKSSGTENCGNTNCCTEDQLFAILREAPVKNIIGLEGCPSIRACPKCGNLISHKEACKHMACPCGTQFCFICLKMADDTGYKCGSYDSKCTIAPRQGHVKCDNGYETNNVSSNNSTESSQDSFHETFVTLERTVTRETTPSPRPRNNSCVIL